ncbi:hypothetical protein C8R44DRAFT_798590 [Mycena epipterygia]|nr:hypothetical protein C8R44DRAFT_798590 [Mycena epipterygia]
MAMEPPKIPLKIDGTEDVKMDDATNADAPYEVAARALAEAQRAISAARATPRPPMISVASVEAQSAALRAEITTLKEASQRDRAAMDDLKRLADDASKAKDIAQKGCQVTESLRAKLHGQVEALQTSIATEREALKMERELLTKERGILEKQRSEFDAERDNMRKALINEHNLVTRGLRRMIQMTDGPDPSPTLAEPATSSSLLTSFSAPELRSARVSPPSRITSSTSGWRFPSLPSFSPLPSATSGWQFPPLPSATSRRWSPPASCQTEIESPSCKCPRTESSPTRTVATNTRSTEREPPPPSRHSTTTEPTTHSDSGVKRSWRDPPTRLVGGYVRRARLSPPRRPVVP